VPEVFNRPTTKKIWEAVADFCIPRIKHCYTVGDGLASIFSERYGVPFEVIRNISVEKQSSISASEKPNRKIILYQGALNEGRCIEQYIKAMCEVEGAELHLAGDGDLKDFLKELVHENALQDKVKFLGKLSPDALTKVTQTAYLGLNLLENKGLSYYYSLANKTFDYIQASVPALHPDFPEYRAIVKKYEIGVLVSSNRIEYIEKNINLLLNDIELYNRLKRECDIAKKIYIWKNEEKKLIIFYKKITQSIINQ
jgi:glycosyltransferase involved in cell wall biosynthesis